MNHVSNEKKPWLFRVYRSMYIGDYTTQADRQHLRKFRKKNVVFVEASMQKNIALQNRNIHKKDRENLLQGYGRKLTLTVESADPMQAAESSQEQHVADTLPPVAGRNPKANHLPGMYKTL